MRTYYITWKRSDGATHSTEAVQARSMEDAELHAELKCRRNVGAVDFSIEL